MPQGVDSEGPSLGMGGRLLALSGAKNPTMAESVLISKHLVNQIRGGSCFSTIILIVCLIASCLVVSLCL